MSGESARHDAHPAVWMSLAILLASWSFVPTARANPTSFSGRGTVVGARLLGLAPIVVSDTGELPASGGALEATLLEYPLAGVPDLLSGALHAEVLHAATVGHGQQSATEASVATVTLALVGNSISADLLMARASATCQAGAASVTGNSQIAGLRINGQTIAVSGATNQTIALPNGRVVINEQQAAVDGDLGDITVNALHVVVNNPLGGAPLADLVISSAHADIVCAGAPSEAVKDRLTGGGYITGTPSDAKGNFAVAGGIKNNGALWGHLNFIDHGTGMHVKGTSITAYLTPADEPNLAPTCRMIEGTAAVDGASGFTYRVTACDNGEPGSSDVFDLELSSGYTASGTLAGGNIQLHH